VQFTPLAEHSLPFELWFLRLAHWFGVTVVYTVHNLLPHDRSERLRTTYARLYRTVDRFICHDSATQDRLVQEFEVAKQRTVVIPHGPLFPDDSAGDISGANENKSTSCVFLWQGIIRPYKGLPLLLTAWKEAVESGLKAVLQIVGTGESDVVAQVEGLIHSLGIDSSVRRDYRFVPVEQLAAYYRAADVLVYPYSSITTSGALMTGIGYGKAILASDLSAFRQILTDESNALLVPAGDVRAWAKALIRLGSDPALRTKLSRQLWHDKSALSNWHDIALETLRLYSHR
jgi:glycosyltransferase involved in cell wall biosynthesis